MKLFTLGEIKKKAIFFISDMDKKGTVNKFKTKTASGVKKEEWSCIERLDFLTS